MPTLNTGTTKAKRVEREVQSDPVAIIKHAIEANPKATTDEVYEAFKDELLELKSDAALDIVLMSWFGPAYSKLIAPKVSVQAHNRQIAQRRAERDAEKEALKGKIKANMAKIVLLDMVLPHGKAVKDSTGRECAELGPVVGAWLSRVAGEIGPNQVVGRVLTEKQLRDLYAA